MHDPKCDVSSETQKIWDVFHNKLLSFIHKRVEDKAAADDILQDVFMKIHKNIDTVKEHRKIDSWVYQIARNTIIDHYRIRKNNVELPEWLASPDVASEKSSEQEIFACLSSLLEQLPEKYRSAVRRYDLEGMSQKEIAELENISLSGAKSRVQRGRAKLIEALHECCHCKSLERSQFVNCILNGNTCDKC